MRIQKNSRIFIISSLVVVIMIQVFASIAIAQEIVIICNKNVQEQELSSEEIKKIFLGRKTRWENGRKISFVIMKSGDTHTGFLKKYIGKTESQFKMYWKKMVFTGKGGMPASFNTPDEILAYIADNKGAVAYLPGGKADNHVKILKIN